MHRHIAFRQKCVSQEPISAIDHIFMTQIDDGYIPVDAGATRNLLAVVLTLQVIEFHAFANVAPVALLRMN